MVVSAQTGDSNDLYRINVVTGAVDVIKRPSSQAQLIAYSDSKELAVFCANERSGTYLTLVKGQTAQRNLLEMNGSVREISAGEVLSVDYLSLDGQNLKAWVILPVGYERGKRYPLVTWIYGGLSYGPTQPRLTTLSDSHPLNLQLLAAHGYAVLLPSMPLRTEQRGVFQVGDPLLELTKGVLPAIDKLIALGIADPVRLAVMGHSFGGYCTYGIVTQTARFKAAIAIAGTSDLFSQYGAFDTSQRYNDYPHELHVLQSLAETSQYQMGNPPWRDPDRYLRNSPLLYADRVQTPLLMFHGDMDSVPISQAEEFFSALCRENKRARFVRYWHEGHVMSSPDNVRDLWTQTYAWLDEFLGTRSPDAVSPERKE